MVRKPGPYPATAIRRGAFRVGNHLGRADSAIRFIANPDQVISNNSMKPYTGIADADVRKKIIDYLKSNRDLQGKQ